MYGIEAYLRWCFSSPLTTRLYAFSAQSAHYELIWYLRPTDIRLNSAKFASKDQIAVFFDRLTRRCGSVRRSSSFRQTRKSDTDSKERVTITAGWPWTEKGMVADEDHRIIS